MTKMGMDVEAVENVGRQLNQSATSVDQIVGGLDKTVNGLLQIWDGPDAQRLVQSWPTFRKTLITAKASVAGLGQSALNNASEQRDASGAKGAGGAGSVTLPSAMHVGDAPATPAHPESQPTVFNTGEAQNEFNSRTSHDTNPAFAPGGAYDGQCTSWVNFRREQLVHEGVISGPAPTSWNGTHFYPGSVSQDPSPYAVGSFAGGGHTFVVESVGAGSPRTISISEMNVGAMVDSANSRTTGLGHVSAATYTEISAGVWKKSPGGQVDHLTFGA
jgi:surface antigen